MTKRVFLAGVLAGIAMYAWSTIAHIVTPLGQVGISMIPNGSRGVDAEEARPRLTES